MKMFVSKKPQCLAQVLVAMVLSLVTFSALGGQARAEVTFIPPQTLAEGIVVEPRMAMDSAGRTTVAWERVGPEKTVLIQALRLDANGFPGSIHTLAKFGRDDEGCPCPQVALDSLGRATVVWQSLDEEGYLRIQAAQIDPADAVGPVYTLSPAGDNASHQRVAVNPEGRATIVWDLLTASSVETVRLVDGTPEEVEVLVKAEAGLSGPALAVDSAGKATVAWPSLDGIRTVQLNSSGEPGVTRTVSGSEKADGALNAVVDSEGKATISWWRGLGDYEAKSVRLDPDGVPGVVRTLSPAGQDTLEPRLAIDSQDRVTAVWEDFQERIFAVRLDQEGAPETVHQLSQAGLRSGEPQITIGPDDRAVVVWSHTPLVYAPETGCLEEAEFDPESDVVRAAFLGPGGEPEQVRPVSPFGEQSAVPQVEVDPLGQPIVVWESFDGTWFCDHSETRIQMSRGLQSPPPVGSGPPPALADPAGVLRLGGRATARKRHLRLGVSCAGATGSVCAGRLQLAVRRGDIPQRLRAALGALPGLPPSATIAQGRFRLASGERRTVVLSLSRLGRGLASKGTGGRLRTIGSGRGVNGEVVWVRLRGPRA